MSNELFGFLVCCLIAGIIPAVLTICYVCEQRMGSNEKASERSIERHLEAEGGPISIYRLFDTLEVEELGGVWKVKSRLYGACEISENLGLSILKSNIKRTYSSMVDGVYFDLVCEIKKVRRSKGKS